MKELTEMKVFKQLVDNKHSIKVVNLPKHIVVTIFITLLFSSYY
jgi:hypothetical protein